MIARAIKQLEQAQWEEIMVLRNYRTHYLHQHQPQCQHFQKEATLEIATILLGLGQMLSKCTRRQCQGGVARAHHEIVFDDARLHRDFTRA